MALSLDKLKKNEYFWLALIIVVGFIIRLWFLGDRWINPDEGAHLMDGKLALDGLVPFVDYESRQPLYVYIIALTLEVFGSNYLVGRFIPLVSTLGTVLFIFLISKKMFDDANVALLASAVYAFAPFSVFWSVMVHMQPVAVLPVCIGMYCVVSYVKTEKNISLLILGGIFFALAYYVRETSLAILVSTFFYFAIVYFKALKKLAVNYLAVLAGYLFICAGAFAYYVRFLSVSEVWNSSINPFYIVTDNLYKVLSLLGIVSSLSGVSTDRADGFRLGDQSWRSTVGELISTFHFNSFLYVGLVISVLIFVYLFFIGKKNDGRIGERAREISCSIFLLYLWFLNLTVLYLYWVLYRGFYAQYFEEFLPPLVILLAFVVVYSLSGMKLERNLWNKILIIGLLLVIIFIVHSKLLRDVELNSSIMGYYALLTITLLAAFWFFPRLRLKNRLYASAVYFALAVLSLFLLRLTYQSPYFIRGFVCLVLLILTYAVVLKMSRMKLRKEGLGFVSVSLVLSAFVISFALSGYRMSFGLSGTWSPQTVDEVADYLRMNSDEDAEVMSGGVMWEFQSGRRPFMNLSHPTAFRPGISSEMSEIMEENLRKSPPEFIILDGYTEQTYLRHLKGLQAAIDDRYELKETVNHSSRYPVEIYGLTENKED